MKDQLKKLIPKKKWQKVVSIIVLVLIVIFIINLIKGNDDSSKNVVKETQVSVSRVFDLVADSGKLSLVGIVESQSEAILRAESSGEISYVNKKLGDSVYSREVIAEIKNSSQRASLLRAQGVLDAAQANLLKSTNSSGQAESLIKTSITNAYSTADDAVRNKVDQFIEDGDSYTPDMINSLGDYFSRQKIEEERYQLYLTLTAWEEDLQALDSLGSGDDLERHYNVAKESLEEVRNFLSLVAVTINQQDFEGDYLPQTTIDKYKSDVSVARSNVNSSLSSMISSYNTYSSQVGLEGKNQDILSAEAQVTQARAGLYAAQAELEKTIIRSPVTGLLNSISIKQGDVVTQFEDVGDVVGNGENEIVAFINENERENIKIGTKVIIENKFNGEVIRIAPAINRDTQKIEIRIAVDGTETNLKNGQNVSMIIETSSQAKIDLQKVFIPITAVKISGDSQFVFYIDGEGNLTSTPVSIGKIEGERVEVISGVSLDDIIVVDARGLKDGQKVTIK
ncbi:efflux RND transporter periplasmic adaptor subunit [Candidatus Nomurabacteria bacterium]|nr:efflux RND transporter periplasmic adaptor subunit [Candidatus Nomurabacteria bacterium]